jgi:hypothetical protein
VLPNQTGHSDLGLVFAFSKAAQSSPKLKYTQGLEGWKLVKFEIKMAENEEKNQAEP